MLRGCFKQGGHALQSTANHSTASQIIRLAVPVALQNLINVGVSMTDTLMIGSISEVQLSASAQANQPYFIFTTLIFGLASGSTVLSAQYWGRRETEPIRKILGLMLRVGICAGILMSVLVLLFPSQIMRVFTNDAQVVAYGCGYLSFVGWSYAFSAFTGIYLLGLRSVQNVHASMTIYSLSFVLNVFLNWVLIFGKFGMPAMEIRGAALATLISRVCESLMTLFYMYRVEDQLFFRLPDIWRKSRPYWKTLARYSLPVLASEVNWGLGISVQAAIIGHLGVSVLAAASFINVVQQLAGVALIGLGVAAGIVVGNLVGEGREVEVKALAKKLLKAGALIGILICGAMLLFRPLAPNLIRASAGTAALIRDMLYVSCYLLFFQTVTCLLMMGVLRGAGDTIFCAKLDIATLWLLKIGCGLFFTAVVPLKPVWVYFILSSDEFLKAAATLPRVFRGGWIHHTTICHDETDTLHE